MDAIDSILPLDGIDPAWQWVNRLVIVAVIVMIAGVADMFCRKVVVRVIKRLTLSTATTWDDYLLNDRVLNNACHLVPPVIVYFLIPLALEGHALLTGYVLKLLQIYLLVFVIRLLCSFLSGLYEATSQQEALKAHPLKGLYQTLKIIVICFGVIIGVSTLLDKNPVTILTGLGASAAILMLVFKDSILGLVAGVQLSANNMLTEGDWITIPSRHANGVVREVTLTTVKVQNFDNTIITIPPYALISDSFQNWRGMQLTGARRVMRSVNIDMTTVRFCSIDEIERFERNGWLMGFERTGATEVNLHVFRHYMERYLAGHPRVNADMMIMIRQLQPTTQGLPVELYFFTATTDWKTYENIQSEIFDHLIATVNEFGLRVFQSPAGSDIDRLSALINYQQ